MKSDYVRELNIKRIRRRIQKIPRHSQLLKFSETLDPFQENFLSVIEGFWVAYRDAPSTTNEEQYSHYRGSPFDYASGSRGFHNGNSPFVQRTTNDSVNLIEAKIKKFKLPNTNYDSVLDGISLVKDVINFHILIMNVYLTMIPTIRWPKLCDNTKRELLASAAMEIPVLRYASRYRYDLGDVLTENNENLTAGVGISKKLRNQVICLMIDFNQLNIDTYEEALIAALCATSPDRGIKESFDYRILSATQETILEILRIKFEIDGKPMRTLAACIGYISKLRIYSHDARAEWFKFIHHKPKICFSGEMLKTDSVRNGLDYIAPSKA